MLGIEVRRRTIPLLLLLVGACTGVRPAPTSPAPSTTSTETASPPARLGTSMDMEVGPSEYVGSFRASGRLTDQTGRPISGAAIRVTLTPLEGPGTLESYTRTGTVPTGASRATVGFRANTECGCEGTVDLTLYDVENPAGPRRKPDDRSPQIEPEAPGPKAAEARLRQPGQHEDKAEKVAEEGDLERMQLAREMTDCGAEDREEERRTDHP